MAQPRRPGRSRTVRTLSTDVRRFRQLINADRVFGTHKALSIAAERDATFAGGHDWASRFGAAVNLDLQSILGDRLNRADSIPSTSQDQIAFSKSYTDAIGEEAERLARFYGPAIFDRQEFFADYQINLTLFRSSEMDAIATFQGADLLARATLQPDQWPSLYLYEIESVERYRLYVKSLIKELKLIFLSEGRNSLFALEAMWLARSSGLRPPKWADVFLSGCLNQLCEALYVEKSTATDAERFAKAFGIVQKQGGTSRFAHARQFKRDRELFLDVQDWLSTHGPKLTSAYQEVGTKHHCSRSTVERAYKRMKTYVAGNS